jgi:hypothetical protein
VIHGFGVNLHGEISAFLRTIPRYFHLHAFNEGRSILLRSAEKIGFQRALCSSVSSPYPYR